MLNKTLNKPLESMSYAVQHSVQGKCLCKLTSGTELSTGAVGKWGVVRVGSPYII